VEAVDLQQEINGLIAQIKGLLLTQNRVSPGTLKNYEKDGFRPIQRFFHERGNTIYSARLLEECISSTWEAYQRGQRSLHQFQVLRKAASLLQEVCETGTLHWCVLPAWNTRKLRADFDSILSTYLVSIAGVYSSSTFRGKKNIIRQFLFFLEDSGVTEMSRLSAKILLQYMSFISDRRPFSMGAVIPTIRSFVTYLNVQRITLHTFTSLLSPKCIKRSTVKPVFAKGEAEKILSCIDRSSTKGKRDYAILTLAKNNGLRSSDILALRLSDIDWKNAEISFVQKKTGNSLVCPLNVETGDAIADYILNARPDSRLPYVFLKLLSPYGKIDSSASICVVLKRYMFAAGVTYKPGEWKSVHTFRRTLGTRMLEFEIPLTTIAQILGQKSSQSTKSYLSLSEQKLSACPLSLKGIEVTSEELL
jgi:integrase